MWGKLDKRFLDGNKKFPCYGDSYKEQEVWKFATFSWLPQVLVFQHYHDISQDKGYIPGSTETRACRGYRLASLEAKIGRICSMHHGCEKCISTLFGNPQKTDILETQVKMRFTYSTSKETYAQCTSSSALALLLPLDSQLVNASKQRPPVLNLIDIRQTVLQSRDDTA